MPPNASTTGPPLFLSFQFLRPFDLPTVGIHASIHPFSLAQSRRSQKNENYHQKGASQKTIGEFCRVKCTRGGFERRRDAVAFARVVPTHHTRVDTSKRTPRLCQLVHQRMSESMLVRIGFCCGCPFGPAFRDDPSARLQLCVSRMSPEAGRMLVAQLVAKQAVAHGAIGTTRNLCSCRLTRARRYSTQQGQSFHGPRLFAVFHPLPHVLPATRCCDGLPPGHARVRD